MANHTTIINDAVAAGYARTGDLNFANAASGLIDATGVAGVFLNSSGQFVSPTGTAISNLGFGTPQALTAAGAVNLTTLVTTVASSGAISITLADGHESQLKIISFITDGGDVTLAPTNWRGGSTSIVFNDAGDAVLLCFCAAKWSVVANFGCTIT